MSTISIVMPVRNSEPFLTDCLDSILAQTYEQWELLVVNDHSSDKSAEILQAYKQKDQRISVYENTGKGITPALMTGYQYAQGSLITRMDSDDLMPEEKLQLLKDKWETTGKGHIITGLVKYFADFPIKDGYKNYEAWLNELTLSESNLEEIYKECAVASPNWLIHKEDFDATAGFNTEMYPEDYCLLFKWKAAGYKIASVDKITHLWRDSMDRASRTDDNYLDNRFTKLKVHYFKQIDYKPEKTLVLWGAGNKGKAIAKELIANELPFRWICNNYNKVGLKIYDVEMEEIQSLATQPDAQVIIAVSQKNASNEIENLLKGYHLEDYFFFT